MTDLEKKLMTALAEVLTVVDKGGFWPKEHELIYEGAVEVLAEAMIKCDECVDY